MFPGCFFRQKSEVGSLKSEVGSQKSEVGSRKSEVGSQKLEVRSRKSEVGSLKLEVRSLKSKVGSRKSEVGSPSSAFVLERPFVETLNVTNSWYSEELFPIKLLDNIIILRKSSQEKGLILNFINRNVFSCVWFLTRSVLLVCTDAMKQERLFLPLIATLLLFSRRKG